MKRHFNQWSILSYAVSVLGVLGSQPATFGVPLSLGGPASAVWAWLIGSIMASFTSASGMLISICLRVLALMGDSGRIGFCLSDRRYVIHKQENTYVQSLTDLGGMYFVSKEVVPPEHAALWAWVVGWLNLLGQSAGVASVWYTGPSFSFVISFHLPLADGNEFHTQLPSRL